jgi:hypothetical protein
MKSLPLFRRKVAALANWPATASPARLTDPQSGGHPRNYEAPRLGLGGRYILSGERLSDENTVGVSQLAYDLAEIDRTSNSWLSASKIAAQLLSVGLATIKLYISASTNQPYHALCHRNCYSCSERENGAPLEPSPTFAQFKDGRHEIKQQRQQKQSSHKLINVRH